jgi:hypothetical protein
VSEELAGGVVDDAGVEVVDDHLGGLAGVGATDPDVVHAARLTVAGVSVERAALEEGLFPTSR